MAQDSLFSLIPTFSLTPNRLSIYNTFVRNDNFECSDKKISNTLEGKKLLANLHGGEYSAETRFHDFKLSLAAKKNLMQKINWLYFMAKSRYKKSISGVEIFNFKMNFITLTLSGTQKHPTSEITAAIFNQFLVEIREIYKLENYVWRLEFQKNGNVHYHIVTDTFTDFHIVTKIWNRCQAKLGYIQQYQEKHALMSLNDYVTEYSNGGKNSFDTLKHRYLKGKQHNWSTPNSCDVKSVSSGKKIQFYISKYFAKKENVNNSHNSLDTKENSLGLRLWFCSRSLSKLKKITDFVPAFSIDLLGIVTKVKDTFVAIHDYCTSYFYNFSSLFPEDKSVIHKLLHGYATDLGYCPDV